MLDKANSVRKNLCQGKNDYETGGIFYGLFLAPKIKYCLTIHEFGIIQQYMTFKDFNDSKRLIDRSQIFDMLEGKKISTMLQDVGRNQSITVSLHPQKWNVVLNVKVKYYVTSVIIKLTKRKNSSLT